MDGARLTGATVVWTGSDRSGDALVRALRQEGADVERWPLVEIGPPEDRSGVDDALKRIDRYSWLLFTSAQAVASIRGHAPPRSARVAAVGPTTGASLEEIGWPIHLVPYRHDSSALADELEKIPNIERPLLFLRGDRAGRILPDRLEAIGLSVEEVVAYSSRPVEKARAKKVAERIVEVADAVVVASPLGAETLASAVAPESLVSIKPDLKWVCLGRSTRSALGKAGVGGAVCPDKVEPKELVVAFLDLLGPGR